MKECIQGYLPLVIFGWIFPVKVEEFISNSRPKEKAMSSVSPVEFPKINKDCVVLGTCEPSDIAGEKYYPTNSSWNFAFGLILLIAYLVFVFIIPELALPLLVIYMLVACITINGNYQTIYRKRTFVIVVETGQKPVDQV